MRRSLLLLVLLVPATACGGGLAAIGSGVAGAALPAALGESKQAVQQGQVTGKLLELDELQQRIVLTTDDGRRGSVLYDSGTIVVYRQEHHPIDFLRAGDRVVVQTRQEGSGPVLAARIDVHRESGAAGDASSTPPPDAG
ncbi:MAG TPA: hypothetical protein VFU06_03175 [Longimicrobiales bacterium]|nr:hypothetical protein [Longimicrobiales bacterium]